MGLDKNEVVKKFAALARAENGRASSSALARLVFTIIIFNNKSRDEFSHNSSLPRLSL